MVMMIIIIFKEEPQNECLQNFAQLQRAYNF